MFLLSLDLLKSGWTKRSLWAKTAKLLDTTSENSKEYNIVMDGVRKLQSLCQGEF